jgi:MYXO-CTERM domain-containing protein
MITKSSRLLLFACLPVCALTGRAYTAADGFFDPLDWSYEVRYDIGLSSVGASVSQVPTGGNLNSFQQTSYSMNWSGVQTYGSVYVISRHLDFSYDPSVFGAISSIDYTEDQTRTSAAWSPAQVAGYSVLFQSGKVFLGTGFVFGPADFNWSERTTPGLTAADFVELDGMSVLPASHPDFSSAGSVINFGYARSNSYSFSSAISHGIDNWSFTVVSIPEPASGAAMAGLAVFALPFVRRRRRG